MVLVGVAGLRMGVEVVVLGVDGVVMVVEVGGEMEAAAALWLLLMSWQSR